MTGCISNLLLKSFAGLDRAKFVFNGFQSFLFILVIVISILLKTAF